MEVHLAVVIQEALQCQYAGKVFPLVTHHHHLADHLLCTLSTADWCTDCIEFTGVQSRHRSLV